METRKRCTAPGCRRYVHAHALCKAHDRQRRENKPLTEIRTPERRAGRVRVRLRLWLTPAAATVLHAEGGPALIEAYLEAYATRLGRRAEPEEPLLVAPRDTSRPLDEETLP